MYAEPDDYTQNVSLALSEVLSDIGVNDRMVQKRRRTWLLKESMVTVTDTLVDRNMSIFHFGSQTEGTTTRGLQSDVDTLICCNDWRVIQDWGDWEPGVENFLFTQDETTAPGYCVLQGLWSDVPLPVDDCIDDYDVMANGGRVLLKNTFIHSNVMQKNGLAKNGPAGTREEEGFMSSDYVSAFHSKTWPPEGTAWLNIQTQGDWPTEELRRLCGTTGFFVVPVGSRDSEAEETEWRVSTSMAERHLMFSLNISQLRCYVLLKMILKTFIIEPYFEKGAISSFMCKTVLFHCVARTKSDFWQEQMLLSCLTLCLRLLETCIKDGNCPHFIIPGNNLVRGKHSREERRRLRAILRILIKSNGRALQQIQVDDLGQRLLMKLNVIPRVIQNPPSSNDISMNISGWLARDTAGVLSSYTKVLLEEVTARSVEDTLHILTTYIRRLIVNYASTESSIVRSSCSLLIPQICTTLGSMLALVGLRLNNTISPASLTWFSHGVDSDVSSSRLKLASVFYCVGELEAAEVLLRDIENRYNMLVVEPCCKCYDFPKTVGKTGYNRMSSNGNEEKIKDITAYCVRFLPCEMNCVPVELQYEMYRSTREDLPHRGRLDSWMDWAVVDSLPYLYFLQYKTYSQQQRFEERQQALNNLVMVTGGEIYPGHCGEPNLGHRETALNLLGQCMEQENRPQDALNCYVTSLNIRARNNAAKWHVCKLLARLAGLRNREEERVQESF